MNSKIWLWVMIVLLIWYSVVMIRYYWKQIRRRSSQKSTWHYYLLLEDKAVNTRRRFEGNPDTEPSDYLLMSLSNLRRAVLENGARIWHVAIGPGFNWAVIKIMLEEDGKEVEHTFDLTIHHVL